MDIISSLTEEELSVSMEPSGEAAGWDGDRNPRDVLTHIHEWQCVLIDWIRANLRGETRRFPPAESAESLNRRFWEMHQGTSFAQARALLEDSHLEIVILCGRFTDEQLFSPGALPWAPDTALGHYIRGVTSGQYLWAMRKICAHRKAVSTA